MTNQDKQFIEYYEKNTNKNELTQNDVNPMMEYTTQSLAIKQMLSYLEEKNKNHKDNSTGNSNIFQEEPNSPYCYLKTESPNQFIIKWAKEIGGKWFANKGAWGFKTLVMDQVIDIDKMLNSSPLIVQVIAFKSIDIPYEQYYFMGYPLFFIPKNKNNNDKLIIQRNVQFVTTETPHIITKNSKYSISIPKNSAFRIRVPNQLFDKLVDSVDPYQWGIQLIKEEDLKI